MKKLIYLATPYSHPDYHIRKLRFDHVTEAAAFFINQGRSIFSPITHSHPIVGNKWQLKSGWNDWKEFDEIVLSTCKELWVLQMDKWAESHGVAGEMALAWGFGIPIRFINPHTFEFEKDTVQCPSCSYSSPRKVAIVGEVGRSDSYRCLFCPMLWREDSPGSEVRIQCPNCHQHHPLFEVKDPNSERCRCTKCQYLWAPPLNTIPE